MTYRTTKVKFAELEKKIKRLFKKIEGTKKFEVIREYVDEVTVYGVDEINKCQVKIGTERVECVEYDIDFDDYKVGDFRLTAVLKAATNENGEPVNSVYPFGDTIDEELLKYRNAELRCDHCGTKHRRTKCVVLTDNVTGEEKMVGTACLKDYIGYTLANTVMGYQDVYAILIDNKEPFIMEDDFGKYTACYDPEMYLAYCIKAIDEFGYVKADGRKPTKEVADDGYRKNDKIDDKYVETAKEVIKFFKELDDRYVDNFVWNTKLRLEGAQVIKYADGIIAYAYVLYKRIAEQIEKDNKKHEEAAKTQFVGTVGQKIAVTAECELITSWTNDYGAFVRMYKFTDENGNVFVWKTSGGFYLTDYETTRFEITGTIKGHNEYNGTKQTDLTRVMVLKIQETS